jgi:hypothetical protein
VRRGAKTGQLWVAGCAVAVSLLAVGACTSHSDDGASPSTSTTTGSASAPDCTRATKVKITEKTATGAGVTYSFSPRSVTIERGGFLAVTNTSGRVHPLISRPDAGIVTSVLDLKERQVIQFPKAGTFRVQSQSAAHRAVLRVTVSGESGCGAPDPMLTITDANSFVPRQLSVPATQNFAVVNESGATQTLRCTPDPGNNRDNSRLDDGETQLLAVDKPGRYTCASVQHPEAKVTITVT